MKIKGVYLVDPASIPYNSLANSARGWLGSKTLKIFLQEFDIGRLKTLLVIIKLVLKVNNKLSPGSVQTLSKHGLGVKLMEYPPGIIYKRPKSTIFTFKRAWILDQYLFPNLLFNPKKLATKS